MEISLLRSLRKFFYLRFLAVMPSVTRARKTYVHVYVHGRDGECTDKKRRGFLSSTSSASTMCERARYVLLSLSHVGYDTRTCAPAYAPTKKTIDVNEDREEWNSCCVYRFWLLYNRSALVVSRLCVSPILPILSRTHVTYVSSQGFPPFEIRALN